jgi:TetR/AcrR family transcriptional regulator, transcriptional repressor for nem operon
VGRPRQYEREEILGRAMEFFWLKGYDGASTADLATALGVNRATMYAEFGSKHALYQLSLRYYLEHTVPGFIGELLPEDAGLDAMLTVLGRFEAEATHTDPRWGCMICAAASETASYDEETRDVVAQYVGLLRGAFRNALGNAAGGRGLDCDAWAAKLTATLLGLFVLIRSGVDRTLARDVARGAADELRRAVG